MPDERRAALRAPATTGEGDADLLRRLRDRGLVDVRRIMGTDKYEFVKRGTANEAADRIEALVAQPPSSGCASPAIDKPGCVSECADPDRQSGWEAGAEAMRLLRDAYDRASFAEVMTGPDRKRLAWLAETKAVLASYYDARGIDPNEVPLPPLPSSGER